MIFLEAKDLTVEYPIRTSGIAGTKLNKNVDDKRMTRNKRNYPVVRAVDHVSFRLEAGDRLGVIGSNGAGKSTLLLALAGILPASDGEVLFEGKRDALFNIKAGFSGTATGRRNIYLRGLVNGWNEEQIEKATEEVIEFAELGQFIDMPINTYSQGMSARLAFGIATAFSTDILLMDEWINAGDRRFHERAKERMERLVENSGIIVLASHNDGLLKKNCNKAIVLERGNVIDSGPIEEVMDRLPDDLKKKRKNNRDNKKPRAAKKLRVRKTKVTVSD